MRFWPIIAFAAGAVFALLLAMGDLWISARTLADAVPGATVISTPFIEWVSPSGRAVSIGGAGFWAIVGAFGGVAGVLVWSLGRWLKRLNKRNS